MGRRRPVRAGARGVPVPRAVAPGLRRGGADARRRIHDAARSPGRVRALRRRQPAPQGPARPAGLSVQVSRRRQDIAGRLEDPQRAIAWLAGEIPGLSEPAARQVVEYLDASHKILGVIPTQQTLVLERFFDEAGGMQLVLHAPFGSRVNRAWGLALRKRFCRSFNFELQAAATEDAIVISLGP